MKIKNKLHLLIEILFFNSFSTFRMELANSEEIRKKVSKLLGVSSANTSITGEISGAFKATNEIKGGN